MTNSDTYYCVLGIIINQRGELLLIKRADNGCWGFVEGGILFGEKPEDAMKREIKEEVGLDVNFIIPIIPVSWTFEKENKKEHIVAMVYLCYVPLENLKTNPTEVTDYRWVTYNAMHSLKVELNTKEERLCYGFEEVMQAYRVSSGRT